LLSPDEPSFLARNQGDGGRWLLHFLNNMCVVALTFENRGQIIGLVVFGSKAAPGFIQAQNGR